MSSSQVDEPIEKLLDSLPVEVLEVILSILRTRHSVTESKHSEQKEINTSAT
jgi:transcriptional regulator of met regulon